MGRQGALTVLAPIRTDRGELEKLRRRLTAIRQVVNRNQAVKQEERRGTAIGFDQVKTLHFARFLILDEYRPSPGEPSSSPLLFFSTQYDGTLAAHLEELVARGKQEWLGILSHCSGFDAETGPDDRRVYHYLKDRALRAHAFYKGTPRRSVGRILWEEEVAGWIRKFAAGLPADVDPTEAWRRIRAHVSERLTAERPKAEATHGPASAESGHWVRFQIRSARRWNVVWRVPLIVPVIVAFLIDPRITLAALLGLVILALWLRIEEDSDADALASRESASSRMMRNAQLDAREKELGKHEDICSQNQLTVVSSVKPSALRQGLLRVVLFVVKVRARYKFTEGLLHGLTTIHFAYWMVFDRGRRVVFVSNYDGSWSGYLDDFVQHAANAMTAIWSHTEGFPATRFLFWKGAADGPRFKAWARGDQVAPEVWYSAYPWLSTETINHNSRLVEGLGYRGFADPGRRDEVLQWLALV